MRNFFEQELRKLFEDEEMIQSPQFTGRACLGTLERDVRVKAEFVSLKIADEYDALRIAVLNRKEGVIDKTTLRCGHDRQEKDPQQSLFQRWYVPTYMDRPWPT